MIFFFISDIIHRDLKLDNILLAEPEDDSPYNIKVQHPLYVQKSIMFLKLRFWKSETVFSWLECLSSSRSSFSSMANFSIFSRCSNVSLSVLYQGALTIYIMFSILL